MKVVLGSYDVHNGGQGVGVFVNKKAAVDAVIGWCGERGLLSDGDAGNDMTETQAREKLMRGESLVFENQECYYSIEEQDVLGEGGDTAPVPIEPLLAVSNAHVTPAALAWMEGGGSGSIFYPNEYGGFLYVGGPEPRAFGDAVPKEIQAIAAWAREQGMVWVKFDPDGTDLAGMAVFEH